MMSQQQIITKVDIFKISIPLIAPFITSLGKDDAAANVLVKIYTDKGLIGFGECSPYMPINGESQDTCFAVGQYFAKALKGKNALDITGCIEIMDAIIYSNNSIKSAFDIALYDIAAQDAQVPLYKYLGANNDKIITTDYTVSIGEPAKMAADALKIKEQGYPAIKVKLGKVGTEDVLRIKMIREAVGDTIPLRIDANQGWNVEEAITTLNALAKYDIEHCEEPIPRWDFMKLEKVKNASPIPIMADECCGDHHDAERLIALNACQYINIKLGKSGGIFKALKIARMAEAAAVKLQVGAMLESRLAMTAFAHFSLCSDNIVHFDFDTALMFKEDMVTGGLQYKKSGIIEVPTTNGLGATIEDKWLNNFESISI